MFLSLRRPLLGTGVLLIALLGAVMPVRATAPPDWVLIKAVAGDQGVVNLELYVRIQASGTSGVQAVGFGWSGNASGYVEVYPESEAGVGVRTTSEAGSLSIEPVPGKNYPSYDITAGGGCLGGCPPGATLGLLVFGTGMQFDDITIDPPTMAEGSITSLSSETGSGSAAVSLGETSDPGAAVTVGGVTAGATSHRRSVPIGIVGGLATSGCIRCAMNWTSPDGRVSGGGLFGRTFAGPAGSWGWSWEGARAATTAGIIGAYAPVGDDWALFENAPR